MHNRPEVNHIPFRLKVWVGLAITLAIYRLLPKLVKFSGFQAIRPHQKIPPSQKRDMPDFYSEKFSTNTSFNQPEWLSVKNGL